MLMDFTRRKSRVTTKGATHEIVLSDRYVVEDVTPRLADLDGDGRQEIVTIRTDVRWVRVSINLGHLRAGGTRLGGSRPCDHDIVPVLIKTGRRMPRAFS